MRFGIFVPQGWRFDLVGIDPASQWQTMREIAQAADRGPWESLWVYDHFHTILTPSEEATHEAWTLMAAFAASTDRIRLGQMCTSMAYRNPALLAKMAATVDIVSGGRVEMGIGAGWYEHEWRAYGYGFPSAGDRLRALDEGIQIMKQAWSSGVATLNGDFYQVDGAIVRPRPLQADGIPVWVAGGGEKVTLKIAAKYANYTNFSGVPEEFSAKSEILRAHTEAVGTNFDEIVRSSNFDTVVGATEREVAERLDAIEARVAPHLGASTDEFMRRLRSKRALCVGTPEQIVERMQGLAKRGLGYAIHNFAEAAYDRSGIELFEREVIPALT